MAENGNETSKKRKRNKEDSNKPSKKVAIQAPAAVKRVSVEVVSGTHEWAPIVGME
jgi:hypothetical protein